MTTSSTPNSLLRSLSKVSNGFLIRRIQNTQLRSFSSSRSVQSLPSTLGTKSLLHPTNRLGSATTTTTTTTITSARSFTTNNDSLSTTPPTHHPPRHHHHRFEPDHADPERLEALYTQNQKLFDYYFNPTTGGDGDGEEEILQDKIWEDLKHMKFDDPTTASLLIELVVESGRLEEGFNYFLEFIESPAKLREKNIATYMILDAAFQAEDEEMREKLIHLIKGKGLYYGDALLASSILSPTSSPKEILELLNLIKDNQLQAAYEHHLTLNRSVIIPFSLSKSLALKLLKEGNVTKAFDIYEGLQNKNSIPPSYLLFSELVFAFVRTKDRLRLESVLLDADNKDIHLPYFSFLPLLPSFTSLPLEEHRLRKKSNMLFYNNLAKATPSFSRLEEDIPDFSFDIDIPSVSSPHSSMFNPPSSSSVVRSLLSGLRNAAMSGNAIVFKAIVEELQSSGHLKKDSLLPSLLTTFSRETDLHRISKAIHLIIRAPNGGDNTNRSPTQWKKDVFRAKEGSVREPFTLKRREIIETRNSEDGMSFDLPGQDSPTSSTSRDDSFAPAGLDAFLASLKNKKERN